MGFLKEYYEQIVELQESEWDFIASHFERKVVTKNEIITQQGETENYLSFIESGIVRFYIPEEEEESSSPLDLFTLAPDFSSPIIEEPEEPEIPSSGESDIPI